MQVTAPWRSIQALTPDATQLADPTWQPMPFRLPSSGGGVRGAGSSRGSGEVSPRWQQAADWAKLGRINNLSLMALDVLMAPCDGKDRSKSPSLRTSYCTNYNAVFAEGKVHVMNKLMGCHQLNSI